MPEKFDFFVIFAEMRTGSNFLESNLNLFPGLQCYGEAFNPYFMVSPKTKELHGVTVDMRNADPLLLLKRVQEKTSGLPGFRFFHDHDPRVFEAIIDNPRCAKIVLTRNIVEAYVSRRIAMATDQWQLNDAQKARKQKARFIPEEFEKLFYRMKSFQLKVKDRLQRTGQTAFYLDYEDAQKLEVINGLARFLGEREQIAAFSRDFRKQNPEPLGEKVQKPELLASVTSRIDVFDLHKIPTFETSRLPALKSYVASDVLKLVFLPIAGGPTRRLTQWMEDAGPVSRDFSQKTLRKWKRQNKSHRTFSVLRHPVARLHAAFCDVLWASEDDGGGQLRHALRHSYSVPLPLTYDESWSLKDHREAFLAFARFINENLAGQTGIVTDPGWASQTATVQGFANFALPDHLLREDQLSDGLFRILPRLGADAPPNLPDLDDRQPFSLAQIYAQDIEAAVRKAYQRDYMMFGFRPWSETV